MDERTDRQTDMTKLTVAICNFAKGPKKKSILCLKIVLIFLSISEQREISSVFSYKNM